MTDYVPAALRQTRGQGQGCTTPRTPTEHVTPSMSVATNSYGFPLKEVAVQQENVQASVSRKDVSLDFTLKPTTMTGGEKEYDAHADGTEPLSETAESPSIVLSPTPIDGTSVQHWRADARGRDGSLSPTEDLLPENASQEMEDVSVQVPATSSNYAKAWATPVHHAAPMPCSPVLHVTPRNQRSGPSSTPRFLHSTAVPSASRSAHNDVDVPLQLPAIAGPYRNLIHQNSRGTPMCESFPAPMLPQAPELTLTNYGHQQRACSDVAGSGAAAVRALSESPQNDLFSVFWQPASSAKGLEWKTCAAAGRKPSQMSASENRDLGAPWQETTEFSRCCPQRHCVTEAVASSLITSDDINKCGDGLSPSYRGSFPSATLSPPPFAFSFCENRTPTPCNPKGKVCAPDAATKSMSQELPCSPTRNDDDTAHTVCDVVDKSGFNGRHQGVPPPRVTSRVWCADRVASVPSWARSRGSPPPFARSADGSTTAASAPGRAMPDYSPPPPFPTSARVPRGVASPTMRGTPYASKVSGMVADSTWLASARDAQPGHCFRSVMACGESPTSDSAVRAVPTSWERSSRGASALRESDAALRRPLPFRAAPSRDTSVSDLPGGHAFASAGFREPSTCSHASPSPFASFLWSVPHSPLESFPVSPSVPTAVFRYVQPEGVRESAPRTAEERQKRVLAVFQAIEERRRWQDRNGTRLVLGLPTPVPTTEEECAVHNASLIDNKSPKSMSQVLDRYGCFTGSCSYSARAPSITSPVESLPSLTTPFAAVPMSSIDALDADPLLPTNDAPPLFTGVPPYYNLKRVAAAARRRAIMLAILRLVLLLPLRMLIAAARLLLHKTVSLVCTPSAIKSKSNASDPRSKATKGCDRFPTQRDPVLDTTGVVVKAM